MNFKNIIKTWFVLLAYHCCFGDPPGLYYCLNPVEPNAIMEAIYDVSGNGTRAVGVYQLGRVSSDPNKDIFFRWDTNAAYKINVDLFVMYAISPNGEIIVGAEKNEDVYTAAAFEYPGNSGYVTYDTLSGYDHGYARNVANTGRIVGQCSTDTRSVSVYWDSTSTPISIGTLINDPNANSVTTDVSPDGTTIVGLGSFDPNNYGLTRAFKWTQEGGMVGMASSDPNYIKTDAWAISGDKSRIVGTSLVSNSQYQATYWNSSGDATLLGDMNESGYLSSARGVNRDGSVIVGIGSKDTGVIIPWAFYWTANNGMVYIGDLANSLNINTNDFRFVFATAVSDNGLTVVGLGVADTSCGLSSVSAYILRLPCPGDADHNNIIDQDDIDLVLFYFESSQTAWTNGDVTGDGQVGQDDLDLVLFWDGNNCL